MELTYVPLLQIQRELHGIPRHGAVPAVSAHDQERRRDRRRACPALGHESDGQRSCEGLARRLLGSRRRRSRGRAVAEASARLADVPGDFKAALVVADDLKGGWTNRYAYEYDLRRPRRGESGSGLPGSSGAASPPQRQPRARPCSQPSTGRSTCCAMAPLARSGTCSFRRDRSWRPRAVPGPSWMRRISPTREKWSPLSSRQTTCGLPSSACLGTRRRGRSDSPLAA